MKQLLLTFLFLFFFVNLHAQIVDIPDSVFKSALIAQGIDTNNDGEIQNSEALNVQSLTLTSGLISDLTGIEAFLNLTVLNCSNSQITSVDLSQNINLIDLDLSLNDLTTIDLSQNTDLINLDLNLNDITTIDLTQNINLQSIGLRANNIFSIDLNQNINLLNLDLFNNNISTLDLSNNISLTTLNLFLNNFTSIDLSQLVNLENLDLSLNDLIFLDLSQNINIKELNIRGNEFTEIDLTQNIALEKLIVRDMDYFNTDLTQNLNLKELVMSNNELSIIDLTQNINLEHLNLGYNNLSSIDLTQNESLIFCDIRQNNLTNIDLSSNIDLEELRINYNQLTELDVSNNTSLTHLQTQNNSLNSLFIKNGSIEDVLFFSSNPNLNFICADEAQLDQVTNSVAPSVLVSSYCSFIPGGEYNTISGNINFDLDNNGCDVSDYSLSNIRIGIDDGTTVGSSFSNETGIYAFYTGIGSYLLLPEFENSNFFNVSPLNASIDFTDLNNAVNQDFCIMASGIHNDLEIVIVPTVPAQPGFDASYQLVYKNKGNQVLSGSVDFSYNDNVLDLISTSETPAIQNLGNLTWDYMNIKPFESRVIEVVFNVNSPMETPAVNIDDILDFTATINPVSGDETQDDNTFSLEQIVVGSYDPNDITCLEGDIVNPDQIGEYLHYNINFENTGTAPATFVVVKDVIDEVSYDMSSFQIMYASHPMQTRITNNTVEFIFDNINLGPNEKGNVVFKIKTNDTLIVGDSVENDAEIFFDYNLPIETNIAVTSYQVLSIDEFNTDNSISVFPNPAKALVNIEASNIIESIEVYDIHGRRVSTTLNDSQVTSINISDLLGGIYFLKIKSEFGYKVERLIKN